MMSVVRPFIRRPGASIYTTSVNHLIHDALQRPGILAAGLERLGSQTGHVRRAPAQLAEHACPVRPTGRLPLPVGLHAACDGAYQALPLVVEAQDLLVQVSPAALQRLALGHESEMPVPAQLCPVVRHENE